VHRLGSHNATEAPQPAAKIGYIVSRFPKLTETFVFYEILALETQGITVEIYPLLREHQPVAHPEVEPWLGRARFQPFISLSILRAHAYFLRREPRKYGRTLWEILRHTWGSLNFFVGALGIFPKTVYFAYEMQARGIGHVHAHFANHPTLAALIVHRLTGIPFSFTAHAADLYVDRRMLAVKVAASAFAVTISDYNKKLMVDECGEEARHKIQIVRCGVDAAVFVPAAPRVADGPFQIVCVAALEEKKGHRYLIDACRRLRERGVDYVCHLVGDGPLRKDVMRWIADAGLQNHVRVHGPLTRPEVARLLAASDAAVLASHHGAKGRREGIPVALMEAMACGLPVVSTAISGIPELVESGRTGYLVPPRYPVGLADSLQALAADASLRRRMGSAGRKKVLDEFNLHDNTKQLLELILTSLKPSDPSYPRSLQENSRGHAATHSDALVPDMPSGRAGSDGRERVEQRARHGGAHV
jgi:colanic acid/amylovoran biosynthesis glycosyltransferase